jgi:hypothetical protein
MLILDAALLSLIAGLATGLGGGVVAVFPRLDMRLYDTLLGFAAGVMTAIATIGLIQEALTLGGTPIALLGFPAGAWWGDWRKGGQERFRGGPKPTEEGQVGRFTRPQSC